MVDSAAVVHGSDILNMEHIWAETHWYYGEAHFDALWSTVVQLEPVDVAINTYP